LANNLEYRNAAKTPPEIHLTHPTPVKSGCSERKTYLNFFPRKPKLLGRYSGHRRVVVTPTAYLYSNNCWCFSHSNFTATAMYHLVDSGGYRYPGEEPPYVLDLIPLPSGLAAISTDQKLCLFDPLRLSEGPKLSLETTHGNVTAVRALDVSGCVLATAGENGTIALWDLRDGTSQAQRTVQGGSSSLSDGSYTHRNSATNRPCRIL